MRKHGFALVCCGVLFVTAGFAATKKKVVSSLSTGQYLGSSSCVTLSPGTPDNWNGGIGNWSVPGNWSAGEPGPNSDVTIYSGTNDAVTLDVGSATISSLTLGGANNGSTSELSDGGTTQTLSITNALNVGQTGVLVLSASGSQVTAGADSSNAGFIELDGGSTLSIAGNLENANSLALGGSGSTVNVTDTFTNDAGATLDLLGAGGTVNVGTIVNNGDVFINSGNTLNLTNQPGGVTDVNSTASWAILGKFTEGGTNFGFENLVSVEGVVALETGQSQTINPSGTLAINAGDLDVSNGTTLTINGNVDNAGALSTGFFSTGGNTLIITGVLTIAGGGPSFVLYGPGDMATIGGLANFGAVFVDGGSTLQINGVANNFGSLQLSDAGGNALNITGTLTNQAGGQIFLYFNDLATLGGLANSGFVDVESGSTLQINGGAINSGTLATDVRNFGGGNTLNITGNLMNLAGGQFVLKGPGDMATLGSLINSGTVDVENGSSLTINSDVTNSGTLGTNLTNLGGANTLSITGNLTNLAAGQFLLSGPGDSATIGGNVTNNGTSIVVGSSAFIDGGLTNSGTVDLENGSTLQINGNANNSGALVTSGFGGTGGNNFNISGILTNQTGGEFALVGLGDRAMLADFSNLGTVDVEDGSTLQVNGAATNSGILTTNLLGRGGANTIIVNSLLTNTATGQINLNGSSDLLMALAGLTNSGVVNVNNASAIDPPFMNNIGTVNIDSTSKMIVGTGSPMGLGYIQLANGTLGEMISTTNHGVINVNGAVFLDGTLDILLQSGFNPPVGSMYEFLLADPGQINGVFANIQNDIFNHGTEMWLVTYDNPGGFVELTAEAHTTPEPSTLLLIIGGVLGATYKLRRRLLQ